MTAKCFFVFLMESMHSFRVQLQLHSVIHISCSLFLSLPPPIEKPECNSSHWPFNSALVPAPLPLVNPFITCFCTDAPLHVTGNVVKQQLTVCLPVLQTTEATVTVCQLQTKTDWNQTIHWSKCAFSIKDWYTHTHTHIYFSNWWSVLSIM